MCLYVFLHNFRQLCVRAELKLADYMCIYIIHREFNTLRGILGHRMVRELSESEIKLKLSCWFKAQGLIDCFLSIKNSNSVLFSPLY